MAISGVYDQTISSLEQQRREKEEYLKRIQAEQASNLQKQVDASVGLLEGTKQQYENTYQQNAKNAYVQKMMAQRDLPQQLAAQGISGGLSESSNIALNSSYGNQLGNYKRSYDTAVTGVDQNIAKVRGEYDSALSNLNAQHLADMSSAQDFFKQQILAQQTAKAQAEEQERQAILQAQAAKSSGGGKSVVNSNLSAYIKRAQSLLDNETPTSAFLYLKNLAEQGYMSASDFQGAIAQIGIPASEIQRMLTADDNTGRAMSAIQMALMAGTVGNAVLNAKK